MEVLHAMRCFVTLLAVDPDLTQDAWSDLYRKFEINPHWRCGCPNQVLDPEWERFRAWFREQMEEDLDRE